jgi:GntR family transcriptional repressor for pyruvate dehydrogenase complex
LTITSINNTSSVPQQNTTRLYLQIANNLAQLIKDEKLLVGTRLPAERELSSKFDVSRQTIREALIALEISGLVEIKAGSGVYVIKSDKIKSSLIKEDAPGPLEIMEARNVLESQATELAANRISNEELLQLRSFLEQIDTLLRQNRYDEAESFDRKFHLLIAQSSRNSAISTMIEWLWELRDSSEVSRVFAKKIRNHGVNSNSKAHYNILENLSRRDGKGASLAMKMHLDEVANAYIMLVSD